MKLLELISISLLALFFTQGCGDHKAHEKTFQTQSSLGEDADKNSLIIELGNILLVGDDGQKIEEKKLVTTKFLPPQALFPFLDKHSKLIRSIKLNKVLDPQDERGIGDFFAKVRKLPRLESFVSTSLGIVEEPLIWQEISSLSKLKEVSLPWEDVAIARVATNSPEVKGISFPVSRRGNFSDKGLDTLSSFKNLEEISVANLDSDEEPLVGILKRGNTGFWALRKIGFTWGKVSDELTKNFTSFKNLKSLAFFGAEENSLLSFLQHTASLSPRKLEELQIAPYNYFKVGSASYAALLDLLPRLNLKRLKLTWFDVDDAQYKILETMKSLEELDIEIPKSKNINTIKSLIPNLPHLKVLSLRKIPGAHINEKKIPPQILDHSALEELEMEFPKLKLLHDWE